MRTIFSRATLRKIRRSALAVALALAAAACAHAEDTRFAFATQAEARVALGAQDDYVRATSTLERSVVMGSAEVMDVAGFAAAMRAGMLPPSSARRSCK